MNLNSIKLIKFLVINFAIVSFLACSSQAKKEITEVNHEEKAAPTQHKESHNEPSVKLIPDNKKTADTHTTAHNPAPQAAHHEAPAGVEPMQAMKWLQNGNKRYLKGFLRKDGQTKSDIQRLNSGQKPHTIIISCSDSRVPPEIVFDQRLGEIFVIRTAGETLGANALGSIEYAVEHLGTRLILVLGHTSWQLLLQSRL